MKTSTRIFRLLQILWNSARIDPIKIFIFKLRFSLSLLVMPPAAASLVEQILADLGDSLLGPRKTSFTPTIVGVDNFIDDLKDKEDA